MRIQPFFKPKINPFKPQPQLKPNRAARRQMEKTARREQRNISKRLVEAPQVQSKPTPTSKTVSTPTLADKVNSYLETAKWIDQSSQQFYHPSGQSYFMNLLPLITSTLGYQPDLKKKKPDDMHNKYYDIDDSWDGDFNKLYKHIKFKDLPPTPDNIGFAGNIAGMDWSTIENYNVYMTNKQRQAYNTSAKSLGIDSNTIISLENIMNSSSAWKIASKYAPDSDQVKADWVLLFNYVKQADNLDDRAVFDTVVQMIRNEDDLLDIINFVDNAILNAETGDSDD